MNFKALIEKYFDFLVNEYGFKYVETSGIFYDDRITIYINYDNILSPTIRLWLRSEPEFTALNISWLLHGRVDYSNTDKNLLEDNFIFYSQLFRKYADELIYKTDELILPGLKRFFHNMIRNTVMDKANLSDNFSLYEKRYYNYIKKRDPNWEPNAR